MKILQMQTRNLKNKSDAVTKEDKDSENGALIPRAVFKVNTQR